MPTRPPSWRDEPEGYPSRGASSPNRGSQGARLPSGQRASRFVDDEYADDVYADRHRGRQVVDRTRRGERYAEDRNDRSPRDDRRRRNPDFDEWHRSRRDDGRHNGRYDEDRRSHRYDDDEDRRGRRYDDEWGLAYQSRPHHRDDRRGPVRSDDEYLAEEAETRRGSSRARASAPSAGKSDRARRHEGRRRQRRRRLKIFAAVIACIVVATAAGALVAVRRLEGNVKSVALTAGGGKIASSDGKPLNILLIGSDSRATAQDCALGGACRPGASTSGHPAPTQGANADVQMLIHLSADRSHAEVISIPRDTIAAIPECREGSTTRPARRDRINSSMQAGVDCTVRSVSTLSGLDIQHVAVVDFHGVVTLSEAVGGVPVCVDADVFDPYSKLKLKEGTHEVKGESALQFVRTRHGFGNGGDLGRTGAQHLFLSSLIRQLRSGSTLTDPIKLYDVADAATKALTVDEPLASASALVGLVRELDRVPSDSIEFVTMPTTPDATNPNVLATTAKTQAMFQRVSRDERLSQLARPSSRPSASSSMPSAASSPAATRPLATQSAPTRATTQGCAHVSRHQTVAVNGVRMTPTQAYAATPAKPDSAP